jgi:multiple sugar transport system ATP-binding protein
MNFGVLQQVGPPQELYERPVNKFVAGFIGSPAMNFINVRAEKANGTVTLKGDALELPVPDRLKDIVAAADGELTLGVRPEHFELANGSVPPNAASIRATTDVVEFLGNEELLHVGVGDHDLVAIVGASQRVRPGDVLDLWVPLEKIHLFDGAEGKALSS